MIPLGPVVARSRVRATRAEVWETLVNPARRAAWWPELQLVPELGGRIAEQWSEGEGDDVVSRDAVGEVDVWVDGHAVGYRWREAGDERDTAVLITLRSQGVDTGVTVTETGFDALATPAERAAASQEGWRVLLADLVEAVLAGPAEGEVVVLEEADEVDEAAGLDETGELELVQPEIEGEIDGETELEADEDVIVEVDAEPQVGDHPELDTGSISVVADEDADADDAEDAAEVDAADEADEADETDDEEAEAEAADDDEPEELDFDSLIRGN